MTDDAVRANYVQEAAAYRLAAEKWRKLAQRNDSLGETARRLHVRCLARAWRAEEIAS
jgi:hypothetical protein